MRGPEWEIIDSDMSYWRRTPLLDEGQLREWNALRSFYKEQQISKHKTGSKQDDTVKIEPVLPYVRAVRSRTFIPLPYRMTASVRDSGPRGTSFL